jgi:hypothetical protein
LDTIHWKCGYEAVMVACYTAVALKTSTHSTNYSSTSLSTETTPLAQHHQRAGLSRCGFLTAMDATLAGGALAYASLGKANAKQARAVTQSPGRVDRPNIILIITDQERYKR